MGNVDWVDWSPDPQVPPVSKTALFSHALDWRNAKEWNITEVMAESGHIHRDFKTNRVLNSSGTILFTLTGMRSRFHLTITANREEANNRIKYLMHTECCAVHTLLLNK